MLHGKHWKLLLCLILLQRKQRQMQHPISSPRGPESNDRTFKSIISSIQVDRCFIINSCQPCDALHTNRLSKALTFTNVRGHNASAGQKCVCHDRQDFKHTVQAAVLIHVPRPWQGILVHLSSSTAQATIPAFQPAQAKASQLISPLHFHFLHQDLHHLCCLAPVMRKTSIRDGSCMVLSE